MIALEALHILLDAEDESVYLEDKILCEYCGDEIVLVGEAANDARWVHVAMGMLRCTSPTDRNRTLETFATPEGESF